MNLLPQILRWIAILGTATVLIEQVVSALPLKPRQAWAFLFLFLAALLVAATIAMLMPSALRRLLQQPDLLVPIGLLTLAIGMLGWLQRLPIAVAVLTPSFSLHLGGITFGTISVVWALRLLFHAAYATWATVLVVTAVRSGRAHLGSWLTDLRSWFLPILGLSCVGWGVNWLLFALELSLGLGIGLAAAAWIPRFGWLFIWAFIITMTGFSVAWNLMTAALLLVAVDKRRGFLATLGVGLAASWKGKRLWWHIVLVQLLLLGTCAFVTYQYAHTSDVFSGGATENVGVNFNFRFYTFWVGGYEHDCRWYGEFMKFVGATPLTVVSTLLTLLFGVLAVAVKLVVAERLWANSVNGAGGLGVGGHGFK